MMLRLPLLIVVLCRYVSATNECAVCACCNNGASRCGWNATAGVENYCYDGCIEGYYSNTCVHQCYSSCTTCTAWNYCTGCNDGYYLNNQEQNQFCSSCRGGCTTCTSYSYCTQCNDGYYSYKQGQYQYCSSCGADCTACTSSNYCTQCNDGYYSYKQGQYQYCSSCRADCSACTSSTYCTACNDGYYLDNKVQYQYCFKCQGGCTTCTTYNDCTACEKGKYGSICQYACGRGCREDQCVIDTGSCTCLSNNFKGSKCDTCVDGKYGAICDQTCFASCTACTSQNYCTACNVGYYLNTQGQNQYCYACQEICTACTTSNECTACGANKYGSTCLSDCGRGCIDSQCDIDTGTCTCISNNFQGSICDTCVDGKYGTICDQTCYVSCTACTSQNYCTACNEGYYLNIQGQNQYCSLCRDGCTACTQYNDCTACETGKYGSTCQYACGIHCDKCTSADQCSVCEDGYYGSTCTLNCPNNCKDTICDKTSGYCQNCIDGYHGDTCTDECPSNCQTCSSQTQCTSCKASYYGAECNTKCPSNCLTCTALHNCISCKTGYKGTACQYPCTNCKPGTGCGKDNGYCEECRYGLYGYSCSNPCESQCKSCDRNYYYRCTECPDGKYGKSSSTVTYLSCNTDCSSNCLSVTCDGITGSCDHGCMPGYWGSQCENQCPENCKTTVCFDSNGTCASGCKEGFTGPQCNCPVNCECHEDGTCYQCKDSFANTAKDCECSTDLCSDQPCTSCYNASFYLENAACCQCSRNCKNKECESEFQCSTGCKEGYRGNGCSAQCKDVDAMCFRCTTDFSETTGECLECMSGHYPDNTNKQCIPCSVDCLDDICDTTDGRCTGGCKDKRWGDKCQSSCGMNCLQCMQSSGTCTVCEGGKYLSDCTEACSTRCNTTNGVVLCAIEDGACLNGCDTLSKHGLHCEHACSNNCRNQECNWRTEYCLNGCIDNHYGDICESVCNTNCQTVSGGSKCNDTTGHCLSVCVDGFHGDSCGQTCSNECINTTCDRGSGKCMYGCVDRFYGDSCDQTCSNECINTTCDRRSGECMYGCVDGYTGEGSGCVQELKQPEGDDSGATIGASAGGVLLVLIIVGVIVAVILLRRRQARGKDVYGEMYENKMDQTIVRQSDVESNGLPLEQIDADNMYAVANKQNKGSIDELGDTNTTNVAVINPTYAKPPVAAKPAAIYDNTAVRDSVIQQSTTSAVDRVSRKLTPTADARKPIEQVSRKLTSTADARLPIEQVSRKSTTKADARPPIQQVSRKSTTKADARPPIQQVSRKSTTKANANRQSVAGEIELEEELGESQTVSPASGSGMADPEVDTYYNTAEVRKRKISLDKLSEFVSKKTKQDFADEFKQLPAGLIKPYVDSQKRENVSKNRYRGIYPYDETRVVLKAGASDYINASFIDGYSKRKAYIASLGPTTKYMGDMSAFWVMVWQEKVGKIVMLTNLTETTGPKCDKYWPDPDFSLHFADIQVTCQSEDVYADFTVRIFSLRKESENRTLTQVHFTAWPDKGTPDDVTSLIEFRQKVISSPTDVDGPVLVHCSAGIGRTGTYIAIDSLTHEGEAEGGVDIYACVRNMREQRVNLVQTADQYQYLYNAVVHTLTFDSNAIESSKFNEYMSSHTNQHLEQKFLQLQASVECRSADETAAVVRNRALTEKNRTGADIPGDRNRPRLSLRRKPGSSEYINALYINSYKSVNRYLVAQTPLPDTVVDFLTLVCQENVSCIICMDPPSTANYKHAGTYYPADNQTLKKGLYTVKSERSVVTDQYTLRKLKISYSGNAGASDVTVTHIQFTQWTDDKDIPGNLSKFLEFMKTVELKCDDMKSSGPILVHCLTGAEKSGLFCVVSILLEKIQIDQEISVVNIVRQIKSMRHMAIPNKDQYIFCHQCLNEYLQSFNIYANVALQR